MQFASVLPSLEPAPRPPASAFGLVTGVNNGEGPNGWLQVPPTHMPWGNPAAHQPSIVRFTAEPLDKPGPSGLHSSPFGQCKRKIDTEMPLSVCRRDQGKQCPARFGARAVNGDRRGVLTLDSLRPVSKQLITEEKMAAHMRQLHISNSYTSHEEPVLGTMVTKPDPSPIISPTVLAEQHAYKRLVMCEELRQLQNEPMLPVSLLSRMQRPSMALVLWQPPAGKIGDALSEAAASVEDQEEEGPAQRQSMPLPFHSISMDNNNSNGTIDLNSLHRYGHGSYSSSSEAETMDL